MISPIRVVTIKIASLFLLLISISACQSSSDNDVISLEDISTFTPQEIISFDHAGDFYFSHLGYSSVVLENGDILIPERDNTALVVVDTEGSLIKEIREGRGPGEVLDAYDFVQDKKGNVYVYDQGNNKVLIFNHQLNLDKEIIPQPYKNSNLIRFLPMANEDVIIEYTSYDFNSDSRDRFKTLVRFDMLTEEFNESLKLLDRPIAPLILGGSYVGGKYVPYADAQLLTYHPQNETLLLFNTATNLIAEINASFDTLFTISVNIPTETVSTQEKDSLKNGVNYKEQWTTLEPLLPESKAVASKMMFFNNQIWLKSDLKGSYQKWFVLDMNGNIKKIVNLPKGSRLTHISKHHLGVRLDDVTFALYEPITDSQD